MTNNKIKDTLMSSGIQMDLIYFPKAFIGYIVQRFSTPVLAPPPLHILYVSLSSLQTFVLFDRKCPAKWTSQDIPPLFQFEASVYVPFKGIEVCETWNLNWIYLQRYILSHFTSKYSSVCDDAGVAQIRE